MKKIEIEGAIPSYGSLPDHSDDARLEAAYIRTAAIAAAKGDLRTRAKARDELARLRAKRLWADRHTRHTPTLMPAGGGGSGSSLNSWFCAPEGDPHAQAVKMLARKAHATAKAHRLDRSELFSAGLARLGRALVLEPNVPPATTTNRSMSFARHELMKLNFIEHPARERAGNPGYRKWTWRLTAGLVASALPGLSPAHLAAESLSRSCDQADLPLQFLR